MSKCVLITGNKEDPVKVANEMRSLRNSCGKLRFAPEEWRTAKQISGYFSRLAAAQRQKKAVGQLSVYERVDLRHPIIYDGQDICSVAKQGELQAKFKVDQLKEICDTFRLVIEGPVSRKKS